MQSIVWDSLKFLAFMLAAIAAAQKFLVEIVLGIKICTKRTQTQVFA